MLVRTRLACETVPVNLSDSQLSVYCWVVAIFIFIGHIADRVRREKPSRHDLRRQRASFESALSKLKRLAPSAAGRIDAFRAEIFSYTDFGRFEMLDSESRLIYGDTQHVLPYVLDRILREAAGLTASESNERISEVFEAHFARRQARLDEARRERAGLVKQLRRHKDIRTVWRMVNAAVDSDEQRRARRQLTVSLGGDSPRCETFYSVISMKNRSKTDSRARAPLANQESFYLLQVELDSQMHSLSFAFAYRSRSILLLVSDVLVASRTAFRASLSVLGTAAVHSSRSRSTVRRALTFLLATLRSMTVSRLLPHRTRLRLRQELNNLQALVPQFSKPLPSGSSS